MGGGMGSMLYIIMLVAVFWFLLIRPQQAQAKKRAEMLTALKTGDKVVTIGGICGKVAQITDNKIFVEVSDGIVVEFLRNAISTVEVEEELKNPFEEDEEEDFEDLDDEYYYDDEDVIDVEPEKK
ncbi:MAG: preprotein translocase subunit YajC [Peptococcaceae bacterium]|jgi:preprotein translocase subunit YajC|nr:preprotein translocase subunit YajC [Peptococcaceae bacterium]MBQ2004300.1 preprotein translocase subunit YajC [Peptococcaceae bacterium]MBQ2021468.1 preprotein translocase subunit YajC [Peptococcaceae bacterium]MBQ2369408.1 preprotein translocase subunit YajC [Peptococcaceae bacterium]MBQ2432650.1 preprotein translocase subunit YajC [Peptococcaceae bacterium]